MAPPTDPHRAQPVKPARNQSNIKLTTIDLIGGIHCTACQITYGNKKDYDEHYRQLHSEDVGIWYTCVVCRKNIHGYASFRGHCYTTHVIKNRFQCKTCSKCFSKQSVLDEHIITQHQFKCPPPCNQEFPSKKELKVHQIVHKDPGPPYPCTECEEPISSVDSCQLHVDRHVRFTYTCPICSDTFQEKSAAGQHLTKHFIGEILQVTDAEEEGPEDVCAVLSVGGILCASCDTLLKSRAEFDLHCEEEHEDEPPVYSCNWCGRQFDEYHSLAYHCYNHSTRHKYKCDTCPKSFPRLSLLVRHASACARAPQPVPAAPTPPCSGRDAHAVTCREPGCHITFDKPKQLHLHEMSHRAADNWCRSCGLEFKSLAACERHLDVHRKTHLACPVCQKPFIEKHRAAKHITQHFSAVLHICKTCGKVYTAKFRLVEHIKTHYEIKPYVCSYCGKGFVIPSGYQQHLNTHTGRAPYKCVVCEKTFKGYSNWSKHVRQVHDIDPKTVRKPVTANVETRPQVVPAPQTGAENKRFECHICSTSFRCLSYWSKHMRRTHGVDPKSLKKPEPVTADRNQVNSEEASSHESVSTDDYVPEPGLNTLEEAYMFVQSIDSESSQKEAVNGTVLTRDEVHMQPDVSPSTSNSEQPNTYPSLMPENGSVVSDSSQQATASCPPDFPREYGPDFINYQGIPVPAYDGHAIDPDGHMLPHIDPHLTTRGQKLCQLNPLNPGDHQPNITIQHFDQTIQEPTEKWEPPIIAKIYHNYYGQIADISANIMSVLQTDIY